MSKEFSTELFPAAGTEGVRAEPGISVEQRVTRLERQISSLERGLSDHWVKLVHFNQWVENATKNFAKLDQLTFSIQQGLLTSHELETFCAFLKELDQ